MPAELLTYVACWRTATHIVCNLITLYILLTHCMRRNCIFVIIVDVIKHTRALYEDLASNQTWKTAPRVSHLCDFADLAAGLVEKVPITSSVI